MGIAREGMQIAGKIIVREIQWTKLQSYKADHKNQNIKELTRVNKREFPYILELIKFFIATRDAIRVSRISSLVGNTK